MGTVGIQIKTPFINIDGKKIGSIIYNEETKAYTPSERINFSEDGIDYEELLAMGVDKEELDSIVEQNS